MIDRVLYGLTYPEAGGGLMQIDGVPVLRYDEESLIPFINFAGNVSVTARIVKLRLTESVDGQTDVGVQEPQATSPEPEAGHGQAGPAGEASDPPAG